MDISRLFHKSSRGISPSFCSNTKTWCQYQPNMFLKNKNMLLSSYGQFVELAYFEIVQASCRSITISLTFNQNFLLTTCWYKGIDYLYRYIRAGVKFPSYNHSDNYCCVNRVPSKRRYETRTKTCTKCTLTEIEMYIKR